MKLRKDLKQFSYSANRFGWEVSYKGIIVAGFSVNVNLLTKEPSIVYYEYHRDCAKQALYEIIRK